MSKNEEKCEIKPIEKTYSRGGETFTEAQLRQQLKDTVFGHYTITAPGMGSDLSVHIRCNPLANEMQMESILQENIIAPRIDSLLKKIHNDELDSKEVKARLGREPKLKYWLVERLRDRADLSQSNQIKIFDVLTTAGAYLDILFDEDAPELNRLLSIFGVRLSQFNCPGGSPLTRMISGDPRPDALTKIQLLLNFGADINQCSSVYGTLLHIAIANEMSTENISALIDISKKQPGVSFNIEDGQKKTPLLMACKTRNHEVVVLLLSLLKQGHDVGLNTPDEEGRTPLMMSAALGDTISFKALIQAGAKIGVTDAAGRSLIEYLTASADIVREILLSIHIEPDRHPLAPQNWLYFNDDMGSPLVCNLSAETHKRALISNLPQHRKLLLSILNSPLCQRKAKLKEHLTRQAQTVIDQKEEDTFLNLCMRGKLTLQESVLPACHWVAAESTKKKVFDIRKTSNPLFWQTPTTKIDRHPMLEAELPKTWKPPFTVSPH